MHNDFLFELGCEELPSGAVLPLSEELAARLTDGFAKACLNHGEVEVFATPRRLAVLVRNLQSFQEGRVHVRRGPALNAAFDESGAPTAALKGFAKSLQVDVSALQRIETDKGTWLGLEVHEEGQSAAKLLPELVRHALSELSIPKPMRWGNSEDTFARPVHWVVMLLGDEVVASSFFGTKSGRTTYGHRFHHPGAIVLEKAGDYEQALLKAFVVAGFNERLACMVSQVETIAAENNAVAVMPEALLKEVCSIVEWPQALPAGFPEAFLEVPPEALIASMQSHQKCFALRDKKGALLPRFITVANIVSKDPQQVIRGNEKVMRARLSDAAFFYAQDKSQPLAAHRDACDNVIFEEKLGSLGDKCARTDALMQVLAPVLQLEKSAASRAALLSKCDLMTGMVGEFPELQGLMGKYYALHDGENEAVAIALDEQYLPRFSGDTLPETPLGSALSLADRIDTLMGIFAIGKRPSGVKDPYKLRRHALAIVRILVSLKVSVSLRSLLTEAAVLLSQRVATAHENIEPVQQFILDRMSAWYQSQGVGIELIQAVRARQSDCLLDFDRRLNALKHFVNLPQAAALSAACKRVDNLLSQQEGQEASQVDASLFAEPAEQALFSALQACEEKLLPCFAAGEYDTALSTLATLREPVDAFFDTVMVMVDNKGLRANRLSLLRRLHTLLQGVAAISLLPAA